MEFPVVFVVGLKDGLAPFSWGAPGASGPDDEPEDGRRDDRCGDNSAPDAEERRLFYVAMTRAKDRLFLTRALQRTWRGALRTLPRSPFLGDITRAKDRLFLTRTLQRTWRGKEALSPQPRQQRIIVGQLTA